MRAGVLCHVFFQVTRSSDLVDEFRQRGYTVVEGALGPQAQRLLLEELQQLERNAIARGSDAGPWSVQGSGALQDACSFTFEHEANGSRVEPPRLHKAQGVGLRSTAVLQALRSEPIIRAVSKLTATAETDFFGTKFFPIWPGSPGSTGWHTDNYFFGTNDSRTISCALYLRNTTPETGCLSVVPGSHRDLALAPHAQAPLYQAALDLHGEYIPAGRLDPTRMVDVPVAAGSAVLFDANLLHRAHANTGAGPSERIAAHFIPVDFAFSFRGTSFERGVYADRYPALTPDRPEL